MIEQLCLSDGKLVRKIFVTVNNWNEARSNCCRSKLPIACFAFYSANVILLKYKGELCEKREYFFYLSFCMGK